MMKTANSLPNSLLFLAALAWAGGCASSDAQNLLDEQPQSKLERSVVDLSFGEPTELKAALEQACSGLENPPSIIFKPGSEKVTVPVMQVERVRFRDLIAALEELCDVRFKLLNPDPEDGEKSLLVVETAPINRTQQIHLSRARTSQLPSASATSDALSAPDAVATEAPVAETVAGSGPMATQPLIGGGQPFASGSAAPLRDSDRTSLRSGFREMTDRAAAGSPVAVATRPRRSPVAVATWPASEQPMASTQTYAIGSLIDDQERGQSTEQIIEAINLAWRTSNDGTAVSGTGDGPRIAIHEPSRLLVVKAPEALQSLAAEVVTNLTRAHQQRLESLQVQDRVNTLEGEFARERDHVQKLHEITLERLKANHAAEIDKREAAIAELEAQLRALQEHVRQIREGGE